MSEADVRSLGQLSNLRERCMHTRVQTLKEAENLQAELTKLSQWLEGEVTQYWQSELTRAERELGEARDALSRCESTVRADEKRSCTDERKRVERAKARRGECDLKLRTLREAKLVWQKQVVKLRGRLQTVADMAEGDLHVTLHQLDSIVETLRAYARLQTPPPPSTS